jgi:hypothetical protein
MCRESMSPSQPGRFDIVHLGTPRRPKGTAVLNPYESAEIKLMALS